MSCLLIAGSAMAQEGHPLKGTWRGDWGPTATHRNFIIVTMDWNGSNVSAIINPGPQAVTAKVARLDITPGTPARQAVAAEGNTPAQPAVPATPPIFKLHLEADVRNAQGQTVAFVADGTIEDIILSNRFIVGTWSHGDVRGDFRLNRQN
jgi:hypothetical protein